MFSASYISQRGLPLEFQGDKIFFSKFFSALDISTFIPGFYAKDSIINGITMQSNEYFQTKTDLFMLYNIYENFAGWNTLGITYPHNGKLLKQGSWYSGYTSTPILVGDIYGNFFETVTYAKGIYDPALMLFKVRFQVGEILPETYTNRTNQFNEELAKLYDLIENGFEKISSSFNKLKGSTVSLGIPTDGWLEPPVYSELLNFNIDQVCMDINQYSDNLKQQINTVRNLQW